MPPTRRRTLLLTLLACAVMSGTLWAVRWSTTPQTKGDIFWYTALALEIGGVDEPTAFARAAEYTVRIGGGTAADVEEIKVAAADIDPRYRGLWVERLVYPLLSAPLVAVLGVDGMLVSAALAGVLVGVLLGWFVLLRTRSPVAALASAALLYVLPSGVVIGTLYAEGWMLVFFVAALAMASTFLERGQRRALVAFALLAVLVVLTKSAYELVLAISVTVTAAVLLASGRRAWARRAAVLASVAIVIGGSVAFAFAALGLPGLAESAQYVFTRGYRDPDVPDPIVRLIRRDIESIPGWLKGALLPPWPLLTVAGGLASLSALRQAWVLPWLIAGPASGVVVLLHPIRSETGRYLVSIWIPVALGLALAVAWLVQRGQAQRARSMPGKHQT